MKTGKKEHKSLYLTWQPYAFVLPFFAIYIAFSLYPILYSFVVSLHNWDGIGTSVFIGLKNYVRLFTKDKIFWKSLGNTFLIMSVPLPVLVIGGTLLASLMNSRYVRMKRTLQTLGFLPYLTTPVAVGILFALLFERNMGIVNRVLQNLGLVEEGINWLGVGTTSRIVVMIMCIWKYMGYYMVLLLAGITSISSEIYEAALVDGSTGLHTFFKITLPLMRNTIIFVVIQGLIGSLQLVEDPMTLLNGWISSGQTPVAGGAGRSCLTMMWYMYDTAFGTNMNYGYASAISYVVFAIIVIVSLLVYSVLQKRSVDNE